MRQAQYKHLYKAINDGHDPLKIVKACATRWLSIETAVSRILMQWIELKTLFSTAKHSEKCYMADTLHAMYCDTNSFAYLTFLYPISEEIQKVNKSFESNSADSSKLLTDLTNMVRSIAKRFINPQCRLNTLTANVDSYTINNIYIGYEFEQILLSSESSEESKQQLKQRCLKFLQVLLKQLQQRVPKNIDVLEKVNLISIKNTLQCIKDPHLLL